MTYTTYMTYMTYMTDMTDRTDRTHRTDRTDRTDRIDRTDRTDRQLCNSCDVVSISPNITKLVNVSTFSKGKAGCTENILCVTHIELKWPPQDSTAQTSCRVYFCTVVFVFVLFILERNVISHITFYW